MMMYLDCFFYSLDVNRWIVRFLKIFLLFFPPTMFPPSPWILSPPGLPPRPSSLIQRESSMPISQTPSAPLSPNSHGGTNLGVASFSDRSTLPAFFTPRPDKPLQFFPRRSLCPPFVLFTLSLPTEDRSPSRDSQKIPYPLAIFFPSYPHAASQTNMLPPHQMINAVSFIAFSPQIAR